MLNYRCFIIGFSLCLASSVVLSQSFEYQGTLCEAESGEILRNPEASELEKIRNEAKESEQQFHTYFLETSVRDFKKNGITLRIRTKSNQKTVNKVTLKKTFSSAPIESSDLWEKVGKFKYEKNIYPDQEKYTYSVDLKPDMKISDIGSVKDLLGKSAQKLLKNMLPGWDHANATMLFLGPIESAKINLKDDVEIDLWQVDQEANAEASIKLSTENQTGLELLSSALQQWNLILCRESSPRTGKYIELLEEQDKFRIIQWK
jgi:inorganic triphosphatase YgiF